MFMAGDCVLSFPDGYDRKEAGGLKKKEYVGLYSKAVLLYMFSSLCIISGIPNANSFAFVCKHF